MVFLGMRSEDEAAQIAEEQKEEREKELVEVRR